MRWQEIFADLEGLARAEERAELDSEIADRTRAEIAQIELLNRLRAQLGQVVTLRVAGIGEISGRLDRAGVDWLLMSRPRETIIPLRAVAVVMALPPAALSEHGVEVVASRIRLTSVLRAIARDRSSVVVRLRDGTDVRGTPDRIGADHLDLALHEVDDAPRRSQLRGRASIAFAAIALVDRSQSGWE